MKQITAINRTEACSILDTGQIVHFSVMLDAEGNETDDVSDCTVAVAPLPDGRWVVVDMSEFETVSFH